MLEIEANMAAEMELPNDVYGDLFTFLINYLVHPDICPLPLVLSSQIEKIVDTIFMNLIDGDEESVFGNVTSPEERRLCVMNATKYFSQAEASSLTNYLGRLLYDFREFVEGIYLSERVVEQVRLHTFSPSCTSALSRMKYCAWCGGHVEHPPCLNLCLNTFRGCLADVAEIHNEYKVLTKMLRQHVVDVLPNFKVKAMREGLSDFNSLIRNLVTSEQKLRKAVSCNIYCENLSRVLNIIRS